MTGEEKERALEAARQRLREAAAGKGFSKEELSDAYVDAQMHNFRLRKAQKEKEIFKMRQEHCCKSSCW